MIQRIQSFYLLLVTVLSSITLLSPLAGLQNIETATIYVLSYEGLMQISASGSIFRANTWMLTAIMAMIPVLSLITIFLFKKRLLQIRLIVFNIVLMAGYYGLLFIYLWQFGKSLAADKFLELVSAFPLVNIVLSFLAFRAIAKDEALIKSLNRLR